MPGLTIRPTVAVQATPDYSDGDSIGPLLNLGNVARQIGGTGIITRLQLRSAINITVQMFAHIFDSNPSASTFTDNAAMVINAADKSKILKTIAIAAADWVAPKGVNPWYTVELVGTGATLPYLYYDVVAGRSLYVALEADGTINFGATDDLSMILSAENN